jgi:hypothetical protein
MSSSGWIGVDLDGTLAKYEGWRGIEHIGEPIGPMVQRVKAWLDSGVEVRIFTARMCGHGLPDLSGGHFDVRGPIERWCLKHIGQVLPCTNIKDFAMTELWDDRAIQVQINTGCRADGQP